METRAKRAQAMNQKLFFNFLKNWVGWAMGNNIFYGDGLNTSTGFVQKSVLKVGSPRVTQLGG